MKTIKIAFLDAATMGDVSFEPFKCLGEFISYPNSTHEQACERVRDIDVEYAESKGIPVRNAVGYSTDSVVQNTFMHILSLVGGASYFDESVKSGSYSRSGMFTDSKWNW